ncbi:MarR family winged helix-turn-helix transcriptional regulator [Arthrobacter sp. Helios]|uniref:MarR family winged helix-turn-helix transcriptional regulator n=1 Tax=Arthrobacter sp. Helios TaxID=2828862 RepID=UPI002069F048|nr:MarR family winged helix-turn-helix transcriptional regulator [Arthrobacter sp. Helios]UPO76182.1 MarR family winged helix-turn-helix transcriptional regulator [Arthrobacter sp. Helios]
MTETGSNTSRNGAAGTAQQAGPQAGIERLYDSELAGETEFLAARARSVGSRRANEDLAALDLKVRSYSVLSLACSGLNPSQRELAEFLSLDPSQIVALVDQLEKRGAVKRLADPRDRRSNIITPTAAGKRLYAEAAAVVAAASDTSLGALSPAERDQLRALLRRVAFADQTAD